jgi:hypothetical protein
VPEVIGDVPQKDGMFGNVSDESYHADRGSLSVSAAKLLLPPSCPSKFRYIQDNAQKPKREFDFGHVAHRLVLGKGAEFAVLDPAVVGLKKDGTVADSPRATAGWKAAEADARQRGLVPIHVEDHDKAQAMAAAVFAHPIAGPLFEEGTAEVSLYCTDEETGVRLRGRCDWITGSGDIVDYKTSITANPAELQRRFWQLGYWMQAAWYIDLALAVGAETDPVFRFVVQEKTPPYVVTVVRYDYEAIIEGRAANHRAKELYVRCRDSGVWPGYTDNEVVLSLPRWALHDDSTTANDADAIRADADALIAELEGIQS